jgi:hypothetical protein
LASSVVTSFPNPAPPPPTALLDHLSYSGITTYAQCSRKFFYHYIEKAPAELLPASLAFGHAFHRVFERIHQDRLEGRPIPDWNTLRPVYEAAWADEGNRGLPVLYGKGDDAASLALLAERMTVAYLASLTADSGATANILAIEHAVRFELVKGVPPFEMRLDLLELRGDELIVTDLKSSRSSWNDTKVREQLPQLLVYAHGLMPMVKQLGIKRVVPRFLVVTKGKSPKVQVIEPQATQDDADRLKRRVIETWTAIQAGSFLPRESWACAQCPFKKRCLG